MRNFGSTFLFGMIAFGIAFGAMKFFKTKTPAPTAPIMVSAPQTAPTIPLEMGQTTLPKSGTGYSIRVGFDLKKGCYLGEVDALEMDLAHSAADKVLLTLESLDGDEKKFPVQSRPVSRAELSAGLVAASFTIPENLAAANLAVYLCKDSSDKKSCGSKAVMRPDELVVKASLDSAKGKYSAPDRNFYVQYLMWEGNGTVRFFKNVVTNSESLQKPPRNVASAGQIASVASKLGAIMPILRSYPFDVQGDKFKFILGKHDSALCK